MSNQSAQSKQALTQKLLFSNKPPGSLITFMTFIEIIAKYEKRGKYLPTLHEAT